MEREMTRGAGGDRAAETSSAPRRNRAASAQSGRAAPARGPTAPGRPPRLSAISLLRRPGAKRAACLARSVRSRPSAAPASVHAPPDRGARVAAPVVVRRRRCSRAAAARSPRSWPPKAVANASSAERSAGTKFKGSATTPPCPANPPNKDEMHKSPPAHRRCRRACPSL